MYQDAYFLHQDKSLLDRDRSTDIHINVELAATSRPTWSRQAGEAVERALQDIGGRHLVDDLRAPGARHVVERSATGSRRRSRTARPRTRSADSVRVDRLRAKARVDCARGLSRPSRSSGRPRTMPAISNSAKMAISASASFWNAPRGSVLKRRGEPPLDVGDRKSDRLGAEIDADQARLAREGARRGLRRRSDRFMAASG